MVQQRARPMHPGSKNEFLRHRRLEREVPRTGHPIQLCSRHRHCRTYRRETLHVFTVTIDAVGVARVSMSSTVTSPFTVTVTRSEVRTAPL